MEQQLTAEEYDAISRNMAQGIGYFAPGFRGTPEEALHFIVNHQLAPSVLARSAFCERAIDNAVRLGCRQVVIYACGYETFSLVCFQISEEYRRQGIGRKLFSMACEEVRRLGADKLYISAHSSKESQAAYRALGCMPAEEVNEDWQQRSPLMSKWNTDYKRGSRRICIYIFMLVFCGKRNTIILDLANRCAS